MRISTDWDCGRCDRFVFAFRTQLGELLPVRRFSVILGGHPLCDVSNRMLTEEMMSFGYFPDRPAYIHRVVGAFVNFATRGRGEESNDCEVVVKLYPGYPKGRVLLFGRELNKMMYKHGTATLWHH